MYWIAEESIELLLFLAPGLVSIGIYRSLTSYPIPSVFQQIALALVFTIITQSICQGIVELLRVFFGQDYLSWSIPYPPLLSFTIAALLAVLLAFANGKDFLHRLLRKLKITRETSFPSEWYSAFYQHQNCFVILHLDGERRIFGWPEDWPSHPNDGHLKLSDAEWLTTHQNQEISSDEYSDLEFVLIPASEIVIVEFLETPTSNQAGD